jgi:signal transduction histidine kinase
MQPAAAADLDARAGAAWYATIDTADRLQLLDALARRFNHDLRTPLNNIVGWSQLLQKGDDPARSSHAAEVIARNAREQTQLLGGFVEDCQIVVGSLQVDLDPAHIDALIAETVERAGGAAQPPRAAAGEADPVRRLIDRLLLVCTRRAREGNAVGFRVARETGWNRLTFSTTARDADWSAADLLELRVATLTAALFGGSLQLQTDPLLTTVRLQLPERAG